MSSIEKLRREIVETACCYQVAISPIVVQMHIDALKGFRIDDILKAYARYRSDAKSLKFPTPGHIKSILEARPEAHDVGVLTSAKIMQAVSKFGWCDHPGAATFIGELGMKAVRAFGGWEYVCANLGVTMDVTTFQAQVREMIKSECKVLEMGATNFSLEFAGKEPEQISPKMQEVLELATPRPF